MTIEKASVIIGNIPIEGDDCYTIAEYQEAKAMAIKALEQEPILDIRQRERKLEMEYQHGYDKGWKEGRKALEQQPCEDCISREEVKNEIRRWLGYLDEDMISRINVGIDRLPSVTPSIEDVENNFNLGYNCGYADAMYDIAESEDKE